MKHLDILSTIGNTPLVKINFGPGYDTWAKLEGTNPSGSIKDRIALSMITHAINTGQLKAGKTILEATSGNTGISLAMIGTVLGYKVEVVMSEAVSAERRSVIEAYGAEVYLTPKSQGTDGAIRLARSMHQGNPDKYYMPDQFCNKNNALVHYLHTGEELWAQMNHQIHYFVAALGTSGTIMGVGRALKEKDNTIQIVAAHPVKGHYIQGLKNMEEAIVPGLYDPSKVDRQVMVETEEAYEWTRRLAKTQGIFAGMSSGAAIAACQVIAKEKPWARIATIFPDRGEKYMSTKLFRQ